MKYKEAELGEQMLVKPSSEDSDSEPKSELDIVCSREFCFVYLVTVVISCTNFFFGEFFKEIGMYLVEDDLFVTRISMLGAVVNFVTRVLMGGLLKRFGLKCVYLLNLFLEAANCLVLIFIGASKPGFSVFMFVFRASSGF